MSENASSTYIDLAADIVSAYVSNNSVPAGDLPSLISQVHLALARVGNGAAEARPRRRSRQSRSRSRSRPTTSSVSRTARSSNR